MSKKAHIVWYDDGVIRVLYLRNAVPNNDVLALNNFDSDFLKEKFQEIDNNGSYVDNLGYNSDIDAREYEDTEAQLSALYRSLNDYADDIRNNDWYGIDYVYYLSPEKQEWTAYSIDEFANSFSIESSTINKRYRVRLYVDVNAESEDAAKLAVHTLLKEGDSQGVLCGVSEKDRAMSAGISKVEYKGEAKKRG